MATELDPRFIVDLKGRPFPTWAGVLDAATKAGLKTLNTNILQIPSSENGNVAIVEAIATFEDGRHFSDIGDACPANVKPHLATALLRIASTRAKGRVLRDAMNVGEALLEEIGDDDAPHAPRTASRGESGGDARVCTHTGCATVLTPAQCELSMRKHQKVLCPSHQSAAQPPASAPGPVVQTPRGPVDETTGEVLSAGRREELQDKWIIMMAEGQKRGVKVPPFPSGQPEAEIVRLAKEWTNQIKLAERPAV